MRAIWANPEKTVGNLIDDDGHILVVEPGTDEFEVFVTMELEEFPNIEVPDPIIAARAEMVVSRLQARAALMRAGLLEKVDKAVNGGVFGGGASDPLVKMGWAEASEFHRSSPTIAAVAALIGLDDAALDNLFRAAAQIRF